MREEEKISLIENVDERYKTYANDLRIQFASKLELLKQKYKVLSDAEKKDLVEKAKATQSNWKEVSNLLAEDKKQVLKRNEEIRVLKASYSKAIDSLNAKKSNEVSKIEKQYNYDKLVEYRKDQMNIIKADYTEYIAKCDASIQVKVNNAKKIQAYINAKKKAFEDMKAKIEKEYDDKFNALCEENKDNPEFAKRRIIIPKELLNVSEGNMSILESDLDKCTITSKKDIAYNLCNDKKLEQINKYHEAYKKDVEEKIAMLNEIKAKIAEVNEKKQNAKRTYEGRIRILNTKIDRMASESGIDKVEKYVPEKSDKKQKQEVSYEKKYKSKDQKTSKIVKFFKNSALYKKITESQTKRKQQKLEKVASESIALNNKGIESANGFFDNLSSSVVSNPTYQNRADKKVDAKYIVK